MDPITKPIVTLLHVCSWGSQPLAHLLSSQEDPLMKPYRFRVCIYVGCVRRALPEGANAAHIQVLCGNTGHGRSWSHQWGKGQIAVRNITSPGKPTHSWHRGSSPSLGGVLGYQRGAGAPISSCSFRPYTTICSSCATEQEFVTKWLSEGDLSKTLVLSSVLH